MKAMANARETRIKMPAPLRKSLKKCIASHHGAGKKVAETLGLSYKVIYDAKKDGKATQTVIKVLEKGLKKLAA